MMERLTDEQKAKVEEFAKEMQDAVIPSIVQTQQERHFAAINQAITDPMTPPGVSGAYTVLFKHIQELEEELSWWGGLVKRACIGTAETPSLKAYIEQQEAALAAKDQQLALVTGERDEYRTLNEHHKDEFLTANLELARVMQAHDTLLGEAVWAMTYVKFFIGLNRHEFSQLEADKVEAFLSRPDVREWQDRQKEGV